MIPLALLFCLAEGHPAQGQLISTTTYHVQKRTTAPARSFSRFPADSQNRK